MEISWQKKFQYNRMMAEARGFGFQICEGMSAPDKPWGAYICLEEASLPQFCKAYWPDTTDQLHLSDHKIDPKILLVAPGSRISLQYHHRRKELWRVLNGPVKVVLGPDGTSLQETLCRAGDIIEIPQGYWHRIVALDCWAIIAEIWQHTDNSNPSNEEDIIRIEDDYSR